MSDLASAITSTINSINATATAAVNAVTNATNQALAAANVAATQISAALTTPGTLQFASAHAVLSGPVSPGVVLNMPSNTDSQVALTNPLQFHGTVNFAGSIPGVVAAGPPSLVGLIGVGADHWAFSTSTNTLTLFAGSQVTDTLSLVPSAAGFWVYAAPATVGSGLPGGVVISSSPQAVVPPGVVALPGAVGA